MPEWYDRAKARMAALEPKVTQDDLLHVFGVTTRGAVGHYLNGRREPSAETLVKLSDRLGMTLDELLRGGEAPSQVVGINVSMLSEALVSLDKALRKKGLVYDAAYVAPALLLAYRERLKYPQKLDKTALALYDSLVLQQLEGQQGQHEQEEEGRRVAATGAGGAGKASAGRAKARRGAA